MKASEVYTAALDINEDVMIANANIASRLRFGSELNISCVVVRAPKPKVSTYILTASTLLRTTQEWN